MSKPSGLLVLGTPGDPRVASFSVVAAARRLPVDVLSWIDFLRDPSRLAARLRRVATLRVEAPGGSAAVVAALCHGESTSGDFSDPQLVGPTRSTYFGLSRTLEHVERVRGAVPVMNCPLELIALGDKPTTQSRLAAAGVPVPEPLGVVGGYDELRALLNTTGKNSVFVKIRNGSSASGVVALRSNGKDWVATTSCEMVRGPNGVSLYNSLKLRRYRQEADLRDLFDALGPQGLHVEAWVPKDRLGSRAYDLRVLVVGGRARHVVVRTSAGPITNLHLGNARGDLGGVRERFRDAEWLTAMTTCERAVAAFPGILYAGVDLTVRPGGVARVLEVNGWGDYLPRVSHEGEDAYGAELTAFFGQSASVAA